MSESETGLTDTPILENAQRALELARYIEAGKVTDPTDGIAWSLVLPTLISHLVVLREDLPDLIEEVELLRNVLVFADGAIVSNAMQHSEYIHALADLYNETCAAAGAIQRAGCHPRGSFRPYNPLPMTERRAEKEGDVSG